jgi:hypothetical protein
MNGPEAGQGEAMRKALSAFSPTQVLELSPLSVGYVEQYQRKMPQGGWRLAIVDARQSRVVWRAEASSARLSSENSRAVADELARKLRSDGLLADACRG